MPTRIRKIPIATTYSSITWPRFRSVLFLGVLFMAFQHNGSQRLKSVAYSPTVGTKKTDFPEPFPLKNRPLPTRKVGQKHGSFSGKRSAITAHNPSGGAGLCDFPAAPPDRETSAPPQPLWNVPFIHQKALRFYIVYYIKQALNSPFRRKIYSIRYKTPLIKTP